MARCFEELLANISLKARDDMTYKLDGNKLFFAIERAQILDIAVTDTITVEGFEGVAYEWTEHDSDFFENNPDADIFLQIERMDGNRYKATGIVLQ